MSCACHGKNGTAAARTSPYDQCTLCAKKHVVKAWNLFQEFTYTDDNRDVITGQLRLAADHLMYDHRATALLARDLAVKLEANRDEELTNEWPTLLAAVRRDFNTDYPNVAARLERLAAMKAASH